MLLQQSLERVSIVYTCNIYFVMHWSMDFIRDSGVSGQCFHTISYINLLFSFERAYFGKDVKANNLLCV